MPASPTPTRRSRPWSLDVTIGVAAAVAIVVVVVYMRPQTESDQDASAPRPYLPVAREPLKLSERLHPRSDAQPKSPHEARQAGTGEPIRAQAAAAVTPGRMKPPAVEAAQPGDSEPTPRPGVAADLPPEAIDLDDASEDIGALTKVAFGDPDPERRLGAVELLSATEDPHVITVLARSLADQNEEVRMAALQALSDFTGEAPAVAIEGALHDPSADIRYEAVSMLADVGTDRARAAIQQVLTDPDDDVRFLAESVLELHKGPDEGRVPTASLRQQAPIP
jgi:HEAT repeat protein